MVLTLSVHAYGQSILKQGIGLLHTSEYDSAKTYFQQKLDSCRSNCPDSITAYLTVYLGKSYRLSNKYDTALMHLRNGIETFEKIENINGQAFGRTSLAEFYRSLFEYEKALNQLKVVDSLNRTNQISLEKQAYFYNRYAAVYSELEIKYDTVISFSNKVIELSKQLKDKDMEATSLNELGFIYEKIKNEIALVYYDSALDMYSKMGNTRFVVGVLTNLSRATFQFNQLEKSLEYANKGIELSEGRDWVQAVPHFYDIKYHIYLKLNQHQAALVEYKKYHEAYIAARELEWKKSIYEIETKYELSEKEKQLSEVSYAETIARLESKRKSKQLKTILLIGFLLLVVISVLYWAYKKTSKSNTLLNNNLVEKEILMQEVHHRVKNNLTFLKSLLYLRSKASENNDVKIILDECQARIQSMALVHQNLYDVDNASQIDFDYFLQELFTELETMFDQTGLKLNLDTNDHKLDMKLSVFLGLILNELITNSFKYAYNGQKDKQVFISFKTIENNYALDYSDNGQGLPPDFDLESTSGFGFKLIRILLDQIDAQIAYNRNNLSTFTILIPR